MDEVYLEYPSEMADVHKERFYTNCDRAFDRFVAAVEDRFDVHAKEEDKDSEPKPKGNSLFDYDFYRLEKDGKDTGIEISGYIEDEKDEDVWRLRYYAKTDAESKDSNLASDVMAWIDDVLKKKNESKARCGKKLNESIDIWDAYDKAVEMLGAEELCLSLAKAMGTAELEDNLRYIDRMAELGIFSDDEEEDEEEEEIEESRRLRNRMLKEHRLRKR